MATRRHHSDKGPESPTEPNWDELAKRVLVYGALHRHDPANFSRIKIGRFEAQVKIGRGGFGIVFKALDPKLNRWVALKLCLTRNPDAFEAFMDEARVLAELDHPNIVAVLEPGEYEGSPFFAMPYIDGQNAQDFAERTPPPTWREVLEVYIGVARGLAAAHGARPPIVHGDVKPANVLLDRSNFARIADFGIARRMIEDTDESEQEGLMHRAGTHYYMAPEVLSGKKPCSAKADQFSFFVALYQTLTGGKLPFYGESSGEILEAIEHTDIRDLIEPSWPVALQVVIRIGLSIDPDERFPDMTTVAAELARVLQMPPSSSPPRDNSKSDEPESDEPGSDGPERIHGPERSDETSLMLGAPEGMGGEPPSHEPDTMVAESPPVGLELVLEPKRMPTDGRRRVSVGGDLEPSKAKRGTFAASLVLVGAVGLTIGWASRGRVEVEPARVSEPAPAPALSPCAMDASDPSVGSKSALIPTCARIRAGELLPATRLWDVEFSDRRRAAPGEAAPTSLELAQLRAETLIVARTFVDQAERMSRWSWVAQSIQGTATELGWRIPDDPIVVATDYSEEWLVVVEREFQEGLDLGDPDLLQDVRERVDRLRKSARRSED